MKNDAAKMVLMFNTRGTGKTAAKLHAAECAMARARSRRVVRIDSPTDADIADLTDRGFTVVRCKCCPAE